jgi:hypothetical protein
MNPIEKLAQECGLDPASARLFGKAQGLADLIEDGLLTPKELETFFREAGPNTEWPTHTWETLGVDIWVE